MDVRKHASIGLHKGGMAKHAHIERHICWWLAIGVDKFKLKILRRLGNQVCRIFPYHRVSVGEFKTLSLRVVAMLADGRRQSLSIIASERSAGDLRKRDVSYDGL